MWEELDKLFSVSNSRIVESNEIYEVGLRVINPYLLKCAKNFQRKAKIYNVNIPFEDFYSNALYFVWEGMRDYIEKSLFDYQIKNILIRRIKLSELKTWNMYKTKGTPQDKKEISYESSRYFSISEINSSYLGKNFNFNDDIAVKFTITSALSLMRKSDIDGTDFIVKLLQGYSSKEAFLLTFKETNNYGNKERKQAERLKKKFINLYNKSKE